ncbi:MAG: response regulator [Bacteroidota bacterium]
MNTFNNLHIVIAEDDPDDGEIVVNSFNSHPCFSNITWVKNGQELLDFLNACEKKPDVILTDINMPKVNGIEALEKVFSDSTLCSIPVFVYSSTANPTYEKKCKELGSLAFLIKPYSLSDFNDIPYQLVYILNSKFPPKESPCADS